MQWTGKASIKSNQTFVLLVKKVKYGNNLKYSCTDKMQRIIENTINSTREVRSIIILFVSCHIIKLPYACQVLWPAVPAFELPRWQYTIKVYRMKHLAVHFNYQLSIVCSYTCVFNNT